MVLGANERGSQVRLYAGVTADRDTLRSFILAKLADETTAIKTGDLPAYNGIADSNTRLGHSQQNSQNRKRTSGICLWRLFPYEGKHETNGQPLLRDAI